MSDYISKFPAQAYMISQKCAKEIAIYEKWISEIPYRWIHHFVIDGLIPFLKTHGYELLYDTETVIGYCEEWAFHHVLLAQYRSNYVSRTFLKCAHDDGPDEKEWYHLTISTDAWFNFSKKWSTTEFLDTSETGYSQYYDLSEFVWHMIHLKISKSHKKWLEITESEMYQDDMYGMGHSTLEDT